VTIDIGHWQARLGELAAKHRVPGATLGILRLNPGGADELVEAAHGVLNLDTGEETTTDTVFQIGSISKVWTATLVLQLVDEGRLSLDEPVARWLPDLRLADPEAAAGVTLRHLLTHTSGIDGDVFTDTGRGDDCVAKYVAALRDEAQNHPLGATWSYCNSGYVIAGRVIETVTGTTWDEAVRTRLIGPLGLRHTSTLPEEALLHRTACGHADGPDGPVRVSQWMLPRALGPAGLVNASVADLLRFARMHLNAGVTEDGTRVLSAAAATAMAAHEVDLPETYTLGDSWGLGWIRFEWDGERLFGHDGHTIGQSAYLRVLPAQRLAVALLTNGDSTDDLYRDLYREIFAEVAGLTVPAPFAPPAEPVTVDLTPHLGPYERASTRLEVLDRADGPVLRMTTTGPLAELTAEPVKELSLVPVDANLFAVRLPERQAWVPVSFYRLPTGEQYVHVGVRATPKVSC
jgi:CubicO group peptidase (beta-lactamase class C family)